MSQYGDMDRWAEEDTKHDLCEHPDFCHFEDYRDLKARNNAVEKIYAECRKKGYTGMLLVQWMDDLVNFKVEDKDGIIGLGQLNANLSLNLIVALPEHRTKV